MASMKAVLRIGKFTGIRQVARQYSKAPAEHIPVHQLAKKTRTSYSDYTIPAGSWQEHYDTQQKRMNRNLAFAAGLLCVTLISAKQVFYFHYHPGYKRLQNINPKK